MFAVLHIMSSMVPIARVLALDASFLFGASHCLLFENVCGAACYVHRAEAAAAAARRACGDSDSLVTVSQARKKRLERNPVELKPLEENQRTF